MSIDEIKWRILSVKEKARPKIEEVKEFYYRNKELVIAVTPIALGSIVEIVKIFAKRGTLQEQRRLKTQYVYDRSNGHYYELRRKPTQKEWLMIDQRKENGEKLGEILDDMGLLK